MNADELNHDVTDQEEFSVSMNMELHLSISHACIDSDFRQLCIFREQLCIVINEELQIDTERAGLCVVHIPQCTARRVLFHTK